MSSSRLTARSVRLLSNSRPCVFCHSRQFGPYVHGTAVREPLTLSGRRSRSIFAKRDGTVATSTGQKLDVERLRRDVDEKARLGFYTLNQQQGALHMDRVKANSIAKEFLAKQNTMDYGSNVKHLSSKYRVSIEDLASLAIVTFKIPELSDAAKKAMLPPSQHKPLSTSMLKGCAQMEDPLAIIQILTAVYLAGSSSGAAYKELASFFPPRDIPSYRKTLEKLGAKAKTFALGPDALTLQGLFLEGEGNKDKAESLYTEAIERCHFKYNPNSKHPMQLPLPTPWNALGTLLKTNQDPIVQARAKTYFTRGAVEGDDPISYYELAAFEDKTNPDWLKHISKAAASGHLQATVDLAKFYQDASSPDSPLIAERSMQKALNWLLEWKQGSIEKLALEWLQIASNMGHKPSTLQLADYHESIGDRQGAQQHLERLVEPPSSAYQAEEWPQLVQLAKKRLTGFKI